MMAPGFRVRGRNSRCGCIGWGGGTVTLADVAAASFNKLGRINSIPSWQCGLDCPHPVGFGGESHVEVEAVIT
jgi:hypothetical protein